MSKGVIFFDIDDTLVDVHKLAKKFYQDIADQTNTKLDSVLDAKEKYKLTLEKGSDYFPADLVKFVKEELGVGLVKIIDPFTKQNFYKESIFPEVRKILEKLSKGYVLGIFSEGFEEYQSKKIVLPELENYFKKDLILIKRRKLSLESINEIPVGAIVIDDKKEVIEILSRIRPDLNLVWINRLDDEKLETPQIRTIKSLDELVAIY